MIMTPSKLRENIYKALDRVLETGVPLEISRKGKVLKIMRMERKSKLSNLKKHDVLKGDVQDIVHMDWSDEWNV